MARYRRVNIDGQSLYKTETRKVAVASLPGTLVTINGDDEFAVAAATVRSEEHTTELQSPC